MGKSVKSNKNSNAFEDKDLSRVAVIILGGGRGARLFPLTLARCKPAVCFGGQYRLIDIPISNALNAGCDKIFVLTQFLSTSLNRHISRTYNLNNHHKGFIDLIPAEEKPSKQEWFEGTADAVRKNLNYFEEVAADYFLILSGDQLYHIDFQEMLKEAIQSNASLTIASIKIHESQASRMGVLKINGKKRIIDFIEKPTDLKKNKKNDAAT